MKNETRSFLGSAPRRAVCIVLWLAFAAAAWATNLTVTGSLGSREAAVEFKMVDNVLYVTLQNTSMADAMTPTDMIGGVFFDVASNPVLTPEWARVDAGSCLIYPTDPGCTAPADPNVGGEWAYHYNSSSHRYGIGAVGFGFFSESDRFDTAQNLGGQVAVGGGNFSLAPKGDNPATDNGGLDHNGPYIRYGAAFTFTPPANFDPSAAISNVLFQYGTGFCELAIPGDSVPEPATMVLIGGGLIALGFLRRRRAAR